MKDFVDIYLSTYMENKIYLMVYKELSGAFVKLFQFSFYSLN